MISNQLKITSPQPTVLSVDLVSLMTIVKILFKTTIMIDPKTYLDLTKQMPKKRITKILNTMSADKKVRRKRNKICVLRKRFMRNTQRYFGKKD